MWVRFLGWEDPLEESMATTPVAHSSILAWRIPWTKGAWQATFHRTTRESDTTEATYYVSLSVRILCVIHCNIFILFHFILN